MKLVAIGSGPGVGYLIKQLSSEGHEVLYSPTAIVCDSITIEVKADDETIYKKVVDLKEQPWSDVKLPRRQRKKAQWKKEIRR